MPTTLYNPGEPVFDQFTGEPYIDEQGNLVEVAPGLTVNAPNGRVVDGDDVANAAWYRVNKFEGETLRNVEIGVPYLRLVLGQPDALLAMSVVIAEIKTRTPGVTGVINVNFISFDNTNRVLRFTATLLRADGNSQAGEFLITDQVV